MSNQRVFFHGQLVTGDQVNVRARRLLLVLRLGTFRLTFASANVQDLVANGGVFRALLYNLFRALSKRHPYRTGGARRRGDGFVRARSVKLPRECGVSRVLIRPGGGDHPTSFKCQATGTFVFS